MTNPIIVLELNELCPPILDRMMAEGELPNFKKLHARSDVYTTWANECEDLEPWVQWVTLHCGKTQAVHGAKELDEGYRIKLPRVWDHLGDRGVSSLVFGSMNSNKNSDKVFLLPDPWSVKVQASDRHYKSLHAFISFFVTEHTNARAKLDRIVAAKFVQYIIRSGLSLKTVLAIFRQLISEKTGRHDVKWRRAFILDLLMWDVFEHLYRRKRPQFATFFANSTAFLQHRYWRHMEPDAYQVKPSAEEMAAYGDAVKASYRHMDQLVERATRLAGPNGRIVFATALSQEANLRYEAIGGKFVYRPHDFAQLNCWAGGPFEVTFEPVMTHQSWASLNSDEDAVLFEQAMSYLEANGQTVMECRREGRRVFFSCKFISRMPDDLNLVHRQSGASIRFLDLFASLGQVNNSQHNRNGAFWIERLDRVGQVHPQKLPLENVLDVMLGLFPANVSVKPAVPD